MILLAVKEFFAYKESQLSETPIGYGTTVKDTTPLYVGDCTIHMVGDMETDRQALESAIDPLAHKFLRKEDFKLKYQFFNTVDEVFSYWGKESCKL